MSAINELFKKDLKAINIGIENFAVSLRDLGIQVIHVDWAPPAGGDPAMIEILELLNGLTE